jgi:hypothetical protein
LIVVVRVIHPQNKNEEKERGEGGEGEEGGRGRGRRRRRERERNGGAEVATRMDVLSGLLLCPVVNKLH